MTYPPTTPGKRLSLEAFDPALLPGTAVQDSFDELGLSLHEATFVVVDLETTGTSPQTDAITEIGAVKVHGGETIGEFSTLINPGVAIPPKITALTGITSSMVMSAPDLPEVLPKFLEFSDGAIFVAHNARFDMGFLKAATKRLGYSWGPRGQVDTLALARRVVTRDETRNYKLSSLAKLFQARQDPDHRALTDARATVDVLHGLLERLGTLGVTHVTDLNTATDPIPPARRRRISLTDSISNKPGVYLFKGPNQEVLYVGTATNLRRRVRQYFSSAPDRRRIGEMVDLSVTVDTIECPTTLEAQVRELRLIAKHEPPYNRRSKRPQRRPWIRLTDEPLPRFSIVRSVTQGAVAIGPLPSRKAADQAIAALEEVGVRACFQRLPLKVSPNAKSCALAEMARCSAPCVEQSAVDDYAAVVTTAKEAMREDQRGIYSALTKRMSHLAKSERFEEAATVRDRLLTLLRAVHSWQRLHLWWESQITVGARWNPTAFTIGAWEIVVTSHGRLTMSALCPPQSNPVTFAEALIESSAYTPPPSSQGGAATAEETQLIAAWMESPGVRLMRHDGPPLAWPINGGRAHLEKLNPSSGD